MRKRGDDRFQNGLEFFVVFLMLVFLVTLLTLCDEL